MAMTLLLVGGSRGPGRAIAQAAPAATDVAGYELAISTHGHHATDADRDALGSAKG